MTTPGWPLCLARLDAMLWLCRGYLSRKLLLALVSPRPLMPLSPDRRLLLLVTVDVSLVSTTLPDGVLRREKLCTVLVTDGRSGSVHLDVMRTVSE